jgi:hypothetical protein
MTLFPNSAPAWLTPKNLNLVAFSHVAAVGVGAEEVVVVSSQRAFTTGVGTRANALVAKATIAKATKDFISGVEVKLKNKRRQEKVNL